MIHTDPVDLRLPTRLIMLPLLTGEDLSQAMLGRSSPLHWNTVLRDPHLGLASHPGVGIQSTILA
jgi:hypothetical protein